MKLPIKFGGISLSSSSSANINGKSNLQMWPSLIAKAKSGGIDVVDTYVFWNIHEPQQGQVSLSVSIPYTDEFRYLCD